MVIVPWNSRKKNMFIVLLRKKEKPRYFSVAPAVEAILNLPTPIDFSPSMVAFSVSRERESLYGSVS